MKKFVTIYLIILAGILISACGGGGGNGPATSSVTTTAGTGATVTGRVLGEGSLSKIPVFMIAKGQTPVMARVSGSTRGDIAGSYYSTVTDDSGNFTFSEIAEGVYSVVAQADPFRSAVQYDIAVVRANTVTVSLTLTATRDISGTIGVPQGANPLGIIAFVAGPFTYSWTATCGTFLNQAIQETTWTAPTNVTVPVDVVCTITDATKATATGKLPVAVLSTANLPPQVEIRGPAVVNIGSTASYIAVGNDPENAALTFLWTAGGGSCNPTDAQNTVWTAPGTVGHQTLTCRATDHSGASSTASFQVSVNGGFVGYDAWFRKYDLNGNLLWEKAWGASGSDYCNSMVVQGLDGYCFTGDTTSTDGVFSGITNGGADVWVMKIGY